MVSIINGFSFWGCAPTAQSVTALLYSRNWCKQWPWRGQIWSTSHKGAVPTCTKADTTFARGVPAPGYLSKCRGGPRLEGFTSNGVPQPLSYHSIIFWPDWIRGTAKHLAKYTKVGVGPWIVRIARDCKLRVQNQVILMGRTCYFVMKLLNCRQILYGMV